MRRFAKQFRINGQPLLAPDADVTVSYADLDSTDGGRDESGVLHRIVLRHKLGTWTFCYNRLSEEERRYMERLFPAGESFEFTHPDRLHDRKEVVTQAYRKECSLCWHNAAMGDWRNYKFEIVEC